MIDWVERITCVLLSFVILANALFVRRIVQAWAFPAVIFSLAWFFYTIIPLVFFPSAHVYPAAMLYIVCASIAVSIGSLSKWSMIYSSSISIKSNFKEYYSNKIILIFFFVGLSVCFACLLINSIEQGISIERLVSNINDSAGEYADRRYNSDIVSNVYLQLSNIFAYFCAGLGGIILSSYKRYYTRWAIIATSLFPSVFVMLSQSAKGMLFLCAAIFYGGTLVSGIQKNNTSLFSKRAIPTVVLALLILLPLITLSFITRGVSAGAGESIIDALAPYWASYTSGHLFAFSDWFGSYIGDVSAQNYNSPGLTGGFYTFMSVFKIFGDDRPVPLGIYGEYLSIPPYIGTNIYTMFRGTIQDFGLIGSILVIGLLSYGSHKAYKALLLTKMPAMSAALLLFTIAFIYQSFAISALTWTTLPVGIFLVGLSLYVTRIKLLR